MSLDLEMVARYANPPSATTVAQAKSLQSNIRTLFGDNYTTFLQGSYKNDTALADINDVDVVILNRNVESSFWGNDWERLFRSIEQALDSDYRYCGKWKRRDKCIQIDTGVKVDLVPAIHDGDPDGGPIVVHSFASGGSRKNWPRQHYEALVTKNKNTHGAFKQTVRLFKKWSRCHFAGTKTAPSYYVECLLYGLPDRVFGNPLAEAFVDVANYVLEERDGIFIGDLARPGGEGDLLTSDEWKESLFKMFLAQLKLSGREALKAIESTSARDAAAAWIRAFNGYTY